MGTVANRLRNPSRSVAVFLSFLWPGLGQWYAGRRRAAALFAVPVALAALLLALAATDGLESLALRLFDPSFAIAVLLLTVLDAVWRVAAMTEAAVGGGDPRPWRPAFDLPRRDGALTGLLAIVVVLTHAAVAVIALSFYFAGEKIFEPTPTTPPTATASSSPAASRDDFSAAPVETPPTAESRINVLLTGIDSSERRTHALTDTLIVVSIDPTSGKTSMVSIPRDVAEFELSDGRIFRGKINSLMTWANNHPAEFPAGGLPTVIRELGHILGIPIHYYAAVNLDGFVELVDAVGGVTVDNPREIRDPTYGGWRDGRRGFFMSAGRHTLDGELALAYVRSRKGVGDNDFTRARRQQQLLVAFRAKMTDPAMLPRLPAILAAAADTIRTNFPQDRLDEMLEIGRLVDDDAVERVVLGPPYATHPPMTETRGIYILRLDMAKVRALSIDLYGEDSRYWEGEAASEPSSAPAP